MKAIHADPREIRKIFAEKYIIPDFQRPYSWEVEHCEKLWEDILDFYNEKKTNEDKYFLGNIVMHPQEDSYVVIDGQQRLTTLLLLIKALHLKAGTVKALEECLKTKDPLTSDITNELRVNSLVLDRDKEFLNDIVFNNGKNTPGNTKFKINYIVFDNKITDWWLSVKQSTEELSNFILCLLDKVVLLPIYCDSEDDALTIFETINNRGMSLTDADIFKAKLHYIAKTEKDQFIKQWNLLEDHEWLFRIYMHILRAKDGDFTKESALRSYFTDKKKSRLSDWKSVMNSLRLIYEVKNWQPADDVAILWQVLNTYPNYYWNFPLFIFLHKHGSLDTEGVFELPEKHVDDFSRLMEETVKYFFIKGIVHNSVNAVKDTVFKVCSSIENNGHYFLEYQNNLSNDSQELIRKIEHKQYGRYLKGLILIASYLNNNQDENNLKEVLINNYHIEHILPKKWNNYDGWTQEKWENNLNTLGNLMPLEWNLNISARNEFFDKKKEQYEKSFVQDAKDLLGFEDWTFNEYEIRHNEKKDLLLTFFAKK